MSRGGVYCVVCGVCGVMWCVCGVVWCGVVWCGVVWCGERAALQWAGGDARSVKNLSASNGGVDAQVSPVCDY